MFKGGMAGMMKKAQQMQENMKKAQAEIKKSIRHWKSFW